MIKAKEFIHLPFTPDLTEGGIAYARRSLNYTYNRMGGRLTRACVASSVA